MRISDWSSDVCSSDLISTELPGRTSAYRIADVRPQVSGIILKRLFTEGGDVQAGQQLYQIDPASYQASYDSAQASLAKARATRSEERRVGKECVSTCRSRGSPSH